MLSLETTPGEVAEGAIVYVPQMLLRTEAGDRREKGDWVVIKKRDSGNVR
jgi:hypothetical protein